ncbi:type VI secretion system Vgr family protein [Paraburkholderia sp. BL25I1N1]|uniref:type VI secretion system Vgr family protein n=1 Tax=Paraburkholderia sp. BL25I1N1 TaxID=1938804 RepID=UPI000D04E80C|nr:type VI secretion system Vgr family protein [Paraburkholderia sp. BL25I1N1]PRY03120.1 type VI secretion system secreted protein VgrG [Paraburkholderia sp. BL25I1N1]
MTINDLATVIGAGIDQSRRLLKLDTALGASVLVPVRAVGNCRIGRNYEFTVDVASLKDSIELKSLIAKPVTLWTQQTDASYLPRHGYVHTARMLGSDGSVQLYQISFSSWLHFLRFRSDARIFQDKTAEDILSAVFDEHPQSRGAYRFDLRNPLPQRSFCVQYEDDWNFVHRLMEEEGIFGYFEQAEDGKAHTLVITDDLYSLKALAPQEVPFYRAGIGSETDAVVHWGGVRTLQSVNYTTRTFDYKDPTFKKEMCTPTVGMQGDLPDQAEVYEYTGAYTYGTSERGNALSKTRMEEWESRAKRFFATGSVRRADVGRWFQLEGATALASDSAENRQFAILAATWYIENNLPVSTETQFRHSLQPQLAEARAYHAGASDAFNVKDALGGDGFFLVELETQRRTVPFRSPFEHRKPQMYTQTATVVGPQQDEVFTDSLNRVKVLMHWDRQNGGDEKASCWLRVMSPHAGGTLGGVFVPRVGHEVGIVYLDGDCDRPVVSGSLFNGRQTPQWHSNGLLSGYKSKEFQGTGYNQLVMDDSTGQNRAQLFSSVGQTHLHLGYLIDQQGNTRGSFLGNGFDLKTDAYGAVRAGQGIFFSTFARGGSASQPLDVREANEHLTESTNVVEIRSDAARAVQADDLTDAHSDLQAFTNATKQEITGSTSGGNTAGGGTGTANGFSEPVMLLGSPVGIGLTSMKSIHAAATDHVNLVSGANTHVAATKSLIASVGEKISLFAQTAGMKLFAGKGKVQVMALSDNIELTADKTVKVVSTSDAVSVVAQKEITLTAAGAVIKMSGGNISVHAPGALDFKGASHSFAGPQGESAANSVPTSASCTSQFASAAQSGAALVG